MAAISQKVPNLLGGVSQQPDPVKLPGQVRAAENVYLDPTFGCRKRPGTDLVKELANDIPADARWFPIFRDNNERYACAIYSDPTFTVRVFDLNDGSERTVTLGSTAAAYFAGAGAYDLEQLTIADYTMLCNKNRIVTMSGDTSTEGEAESLVVIKQVAYNTTYNVDINDAGSEPSKVYQATGIEVIPGSYEEADGGTCGDVDAQEFNEDDPTDGTKTGLSFRLVNQCAAYLSGGNFKSYKLTHVSYNNQYLIDLGEGRFTEAFSGFSVNWDIQYDDDYGWDFYYTVTNTGYQRNKIQGTFTGSLGTVVTTQSWASKTESDAGYVSRYTTDAILQNGGTGWRVGDQVSVTMKGRSFTIRVTSDRFIYAYNSVGTASVTTPSNVEAGTLDVSLVATELVTDINAFDGFEAESVGNVIRIRRAGGDEYNISARGGTVNSALSVIKGFARDISKLPEQGWDGTLLKVSNTEEDSDDYYVRFTTQSPGIPGAGTWEETVAPGIKTSFNTSTLPHALIRQADGTFTLDTLNESSAFGGWAPRVVGDEKTNPEPSFVGRTISNMFFYANRLGFTSEDAVVMSQPGDYFNFFQTSAIAISDADPIDLTASSTKPAIIKGVSTSPKGLILFAERSQFLLGTSELVFAAATVRMNEISNYFYRSLVQPLNSGVSISFISESATYAKVMEMAVDSVENRPAVADITRVIPEFLPPALTWGEVLPNNNMLVYGDGSEDVYVFKFFNNGNERQLAGWTRWTYPADVSLFAAEDDFCYLVTYDGTRFSLSTSSLTDDPDDAPLDVGFSSFSPRLDMSVSSSDLTVTDLGGGRSKIDIPAGLQITNNDVTLVVTDGSYKGAFIEVSPSYSPWCIEVDTSLVESEFVIGLGYTSSVTLPAIFVTQDGRADRVNVPQVQFLYLDLYYSGRYDVTVNKLGYAPYTQSFELTTANIYSADNAPVSELSTITMPIFSRGDTVTTTITAPDPYPSSITGYSWDGTYNNRGVSPIR